jgi:hypothetical protein
MAPEIREVAQSIWSLVQKLNPKSPEYNASV